MGSKLPPNFYIKLPPKFDYMLRDTVKVWQTQDSWVYSSVST